MTNAINNGIIIIQREKGEIFDGSIYSDWNSGSCFTSRIWISVFDWRCYLMSVFLITAPSGAGKTTLAQSLQKNRYWEECMSHTTRPMRDGEAEGVTYYYIDEKSFLESVKGGHFAEHVKYDGHFYGISKREIERVMGKGGHVFIIVNYDGYEQVKEAYPDAVGIFIHMSKEDCLANMLLRGDKIEKAMDRIKTYDEEMKNRHDYDYVIKNVRGKQSSTETILRAIVNQHS